MCLAIPAKITELKENRLATVDILGVKRDIALDLTPQAEPGDFVLVHAGINPGKAAGRYDGTLESLDALLRAQTVEDHGWIRGEFWGQPTGLIDRQGRGPQVIAGHTPTVLLERFAYQPCEPFTDEEGRGKIVELGATWDTGGVPDRVNIDCSAAAGPGQGRVGILRLDDGARFYATIEDGE